VRGNAAGTSVRGERRQLQRKVVGIDVGALRAVDVRENHGLILNRLFTESALDILDVDIKRSRRGRSGTPIMRASASLTDQAMEVDFLRAERFESGGGHARNGSTRKRATTRFTDRNNTGRTL
jgi:hypothetical protein